MSGIETAQEQQVAAGILSGFLGGIPLYIAIADNLKGMQPDLGLFNIIWPAVWIGGFMVAVIPHPDNPYAYGHSKYDQQGFLKRYFGGVVIGTTAGTFLTFALPSAHGETLNNYDGANSPEVIVVAAPQQDKQPQYRFVPVDGPGPVLEF